MILASVHFNEYDDAAGHRHFIEPKATAAGLRVRIKPVHSGFLVLVKGQDASKRQQAMDIATRTISLGAAMESAGLVAKRVTTMGGSLVTPHYRLRCGAVYSFRFDGEVRRLGL